MQPRRVALLLASLLCLQTVSSLTCFTCDKQESNWDCLSSKICADSDNYCLTKYFGGSVGESRKVSISKECSPSCPQVGIDLGLVAFSVKCCNHSFCNISGAASVRSSSLLLAVGVLASFLYMFGVKL